jgi:hypothetical protein
MKDLLEQGNYVFIRTALFWVITQRVVVIPYRRFGTTYQCHLQGFFRTALFWVITQRVVVIPYRRVGTTYQSHLQGFIRTALFWVITQRVVVIPYRRFGFHYSLRINPEKHSLPLLGGGNLKSRTCSLCYHCT